MAVRAPIAARVKPVIVLGIDTPIGLTVVRELGRHGVLVHGIGRSEQAIGAQSRYCTTSSVRPSGQAIADWLPALIDNVGAKALLAISEDDLIALSNMPAVVAGCRILTPRAGPLSIVLDKRQTLAAALAVGIDVPHSWQPQAGEDFGSKTAEFTFPIVAKWPDPPSIVKILADADIPLHKAEFIKDKAALEALLARYVPLGQWPLIQQYCAGVGLGQMFHIEGGTATLRFQHRRCHEWPPEGGVSTLCVSEPVEYHQAQRVLSEKLLHSIGWQGTAMVEYRFDAATGRYWLMEINGRFWGSLPLASHAGAEFAWEAYSQAFGADQSRPRRYRAGVRARFMIPETRRLLRLLFERSAIADPSFIPRPLTDLLNYFVSFIDPRMRYYIFSWRDPMPFVADTISMIRKALRRETY